MIRQTWRRLTKSPLSLAAALLAFALGIGVNTAMYSICDALIFRPVELKNLERLVVFDTFLRGAEQGLYESSPADFYDFQKALGARGELAFAQMWDATVTRDGEPEQVQAVQVSANWPAVLGMQLAAGRVFLPGEDSVGRNKVALITEGLAQRRFGGPSALGRQIRLNNEDYLVAGIVKSTSPFPTMAQIFVPQPTTVEFTHDRTGFRLMVAALPKPGVSLGQMRTQIEATQAAIVAAHGKTHAGRNVGIAPLNERVTGTNDMPVSYARMLLYATGFVLLLACANVANLQLARVTSRSREFAIRSALGASRWRVATEVFMEASLLSVGGAMLGCIFAVFSVDLIRNLIPTELWIYAPMWRQVGLNWFALGATVALSIAAGVLTGVLPAWTSTKADAQDCLREGGRAMSAGAARQWFRAGMVAFQMSVALILLIGAGLMVRGTQALFERFSGNRPEQVATAQAILPATKYPEAAQRGEFIRKLEAELERLPGRGDYGLVNYVPFGENISLAPVVIEGRPEPTVAERPRISTLAASGGFFAALGIALRQGRLFHAGDGPDAEKVCVIDETFMASLFPGENPLGRRVSLAGTAERDWCRIVGVVGAIFQDPWAREPYRTLYRPMAQVRPRSVSIVLRTEAPMESMLPALQQSVLAVDGEQPVRQLKSQWGLLETSLAGMKMVATLMAGIGMIALVLSAVGVYSVVSYVVSERTSEIGMRMAMGASARDVFALVSRQTLLMCGAGIAVGLAAGYSLAQLFSGLIFGVSASDFWSLSSVSLLLASVGLVAMYLPARRAMRLDPMDALRHD